MALWALSFRREVGESLIEIQVIDTPQNVDVFFCTEEYGGGTASANPMGEDGQWWISRVLVRPESARGQGYGSQLLSKLKETVVKYGCKQLVVCPSGYNSDKKQQMDFYIKNGFIHKDKGTLIWDIA
jgi:GNAT superfamily N-acetyltransferase